MRITNEKQYNDAVNDINSIMKRGEDNVSVEDLDTLKALTNQVQEYESKHYVFPVPKTVVDMVKFKMFEKDMSQTDLANETNIPLPKINQILKGKRKPDLTFLKGVYDTLNIPADFILSRI